MKSYEELLSDIEEDIKAIAPTLIQYIEDEIIDFPKGMPLVFADARDSI